MATAHDSIEEYPNIRFRLVMGRKEPYVLDTGLAVWEIAMLAPIYDGNPDGIAAHTGADSVLIEEGLRYAEECAGEMQAQIARHTVDSLDELQRRFPGVPILVIDIPPEEESS